MKDVVCHVCSNMCSNLEIFLLRLSSLQSLVSAVKIELTSPRYSLYSRQSRVWSMKASLVIIRRMIPRILLIQQEIASLKHKRSHDSISTETRI